jgi:hypothetical protein
MTSAREELLQLLSYHTERALTERETLQLTGLLQSDSRLIDVYVDYMTLHGLLHWDVGSTFQSLPESTQFSKVVLSKSGDTHSAQMTNRLSSKWVAIAAVLLSLAASWLFVSQSGQNSAEFVSNDTNQGAVPKRDLADDAKRRSTAHVDTAGAAPDIKPLMLNNGKHIEKMAPEVIADAGPAEADSESLTADLTDAQIVEQINELIAQGLTENEVLPSPVASDSEWVRRVYLTAAGRIPTLEETQQFLTSDSPRKQQSLLERVIGSPENSANMAALWTNLLVGRTPRNHVNRDKLYEFLETAFLENKPWIDTVGDLITARGRNDQNGATNFLLAHLNNEATPATAVTAKLFLGEQISCVQCHDHPFAPGVTQREYWALNAFFKDTTGVSVPLADAGGKGMKEIPWKLIDKVREERMTHFETRSGQQQAVLPRYNGQTMPQDSLENRRDRLADLLAADSDAKVARAMVNRMWAQFFGFGFTAQIDDMGPHAAISHPDLLNMLSEAFVKSGYDVRRLMKWIASSDAWSRSSEMIAENSVDRPDHGETPLFSRVYVHRMSPEQVYESVRIAIRSTAGVPADKDDATVEHRRQWVQQFAHAYDTDENDESIGFDGSIAQAMVMMNGVEVGEAITQATNAMVSASQKHVVPVTETLDRVALAMLNRQPTDSEEKIFRAHYRKLAQQTSPATAMPVAIEDMMWAYLNSSEFVLVH